MIASLPVAGRLASGATSVASRLVTPVSQVQTTVTPTPTSSTPTSSNTGLPGALAPSLTQQRAVSTAQAAPTSLVRAALPTPRWQPSGPTSPGGASPVQPVEMPSGPSPTPAPDELVALPGSGGPVGWPDSPVTPTKKMLSPVSTPRAASSSSSSPVVPIAVVAAIGVAVFFATR